MTSNDIIIQPLKEYTCFQLRAVFEAILYNGWMDYTQRHLTSSGIPEPVITVHNPSHQWWEDF